MLTREERARLLEDELLIVRHSGEIPEIALHSSLYYLTRDNEGPRIELTGEEMEKLYDAAEERYREIVLRDIDPKNRDLRIYRGVARTMANWHRYRTFCGRINRDCSEFKAVVAQRLLKFLGVEYEDVASGERSSSINCSREQLNEFLPALGVERIDLPPDWQQVICPHK